MAGTDPRIYDQNALDTISAQVEHLSQTSRTSGTALQALQVDMHHLVKAVDRLTSVAEKQSELAASVSLQAASLDRVNTDLRKLDGHFAEAIKELTRTLKDDQKETKIVADTVVGYRAGLRLLVIVSAVVGSLLVTVATITVGELKTKDTALELQITRNKDERDKTLGEMNQRLRRLELKSGDEVAP